MIWMKWTWPAMSPFAQPSNLPFADHMHRFIALDRPLGAGEGAKAQARVYPPFDRTMILLNNIVEIGNHAAATSPAECMIPFQFANHSGIGGVTVHIDHTWARAVRFRKRLAKERSSRRQIASRRKIEVDRGASRVHRPI